MLIVKLSKVGINNYLSKEDEEGKKLYGSEQHSKRTKVTYRPRQHHFLAFLWRQLRIAKEKWEFC